MGRNGLIKEEKPDGTDSDCSIFVGTVNGKKFVLQDSSNYYYQGNDMPEKLMFPAAASSLQDLGLFALKIYNLDLRLIPP